MIHIHTTRFVLSSPLTVAAYRDTRHDIRCVVAINGSDGSCGVRFQWIKQRTAKKHIETGF